MELCYPAAFWADSIPNVLLLSVRCSCWKYCGHLALAQRAVRLVLAPAPVSWCRESWGKEAESSLHTPKLLIDIAALTAWACWSNNVLGDTLSTGVTFGHRNIALLPWWLVLKSVEIYLCLLKHEILISFSLCSLEDLGESKTRMNAENADLPIQNSQHFLPTLMHVATWISWYGGYI